MAYPSSIDAPGGTAAQGTSLLTSPDHSQDHRVLGSAVIAIETKLGVSAGSPVANAFLKGSGNGTSVWSTSLDNLSFGSPTITGGTIKNPVIGTPAISSGTFNNGVFGTPTLVIGSDARGDIYTRSSGGAVTRIAAGAVGQVLKGQGIGTEPAFGNLGILGNTVTPTGTQTTTATSATPMANGTLSIPITAISNVQVFANAYMGNNAAGGYCFLSMTVNGTQVGIEPATFQGEDHGISTNGFLGSVAVGTYPAIIKFRGSSGTATAYQANLWYNSYPV